MANNKIQVKRTNVAGRTANVSAPANTQYIDAGEFALNMADRILYTSNGSSLITVGANQVNQNISGNLTVKAIIANGSLGTAGQVLTTNATSVYWSDAAGGSGGGYYKGGSSTIGTLANQGQNLFRVNANTLNTNTTIVAGENAQATGPISVTSGVTLTVQSGGRVSIV